MLTKFALSVKEIASFLSKLYKIIYATPENTTKHIGNLKLKMAQQAAKERQRDFDQNSRPSPTDREALLTARKKLTSCKKNRRWQLSVRHLKNEAEEQSPPDDSSFYSERKKQQRDKGRNTHDTIHGARPRQNFSPQTKKMQMRSMIESNS